MMKKSIILLLYFSKLVATSIRYYHIFYYNYSYQYAFTKVKYHSQVKFDIIQQQRAPAVHAKRTVGASQRRAVFAYRRVTQGP